MPKHFWSESQLHVIRPLVHINIKENIFKDMILDLNFLHDVEKGIVRMLEKIIGSIKGLEGFL